MMMSFLHYVEGWRRRSDAMTLVELLAVIAIVSVVLAFTAPVLDGLGRSYRRDASLNALVDTFERARSSALSESRPHRIVFSVSDEVPKDYRDRAYAIFRDDDDGNPIQITGWKLLGEGIFFRKGNTADTSLVGTAATRTDIYFPPAQASIVLPYLQFDALGRVGQPIDPRLCRLELSAERYVNSSDKNDVSMIDVVTVSRLTGRVKLERREPPKKRGA